MEITASKHINNQNGKKVHTSFFHYVRPQRGKDSSVVEIYGLLSVHSKVEIPGSKIVKFAWDGIVDGFEYSKTDSFNESLKVSLQESTRRLKQLIGSDPVLAEQGIEVDFAIFVFKQKSVYVGLLGDNDIYIYKKGRLVNITEMLNKKNARTAGLIMDEQDLIIASTQGLIQENISKIIGQQNKECIKEKIAEVEGCLRSEEGYVTFECNTGVKSVTPVECVDEVPVEVSRNPLTTASIKNLDSDYISLDKEESLLDSSNERSEKDLRYFVSIFSNNFSKIWTYFKLHLVSLLSKIPVLFSRLASVLKASVKKKLEHKRFFKKFSAKVSQTNLGRRKVDSDLKSLQIDGYKKKGKRAERFKIVLMVLGIVVLLVLGVKFTIDQREASAIHKQANNILIEVEDLISKAEDKVYTDRNSTETYIYKAQNELDGIPQGLNEEDESRMRSLEGRVLGLQDDLYKRSGVKEDDSSMESYVDTRLAFGEGSGSSDIALYKDSRNNEYLVVVDTELKSVYRISLYNKEVKKLPDTQGVLKDPKFVYAGKSGIFVLDMSVGVLRAEYDKDGWFKSFEVLTGLGINSLGVEDVGEFAVLTDSDNVYILDRTKKALLKSTNFSSGYGLSFAYIENDAFVEANEILSDLSVYILTPGIDGLRRYNFSAAEQKQIPAPVSVAGLNGEFKNLKYGYTQQSLDYGLYLFDSEEKRFLNFEKPKEGGGEILHPDQVVLDKQYIYRGTRENVFGNVHDFVVDGKEQYMYVLDGSTIWKVRL